MAISKAKKLIWLQKFLNYFQTANPTVFAQYNGLSVADVQNLRRFSSLKLA